MNRREIIKNLSALPFAGAMMYPFDSASESESQPRRGAAAPAQNIYQRIGVEPFINCRGTLTVIGGSIERPEVVQAKNEASPFFVQLDELNIAIGRRLAELTGAEWGMVSCGCAAGMKHVTAACVTGGDPELLVRIPDDLTGFEKTEVIIPRRSRNTYDAAIRNIGVTIVIVDTPEEMERAINSKTAMIYIMSNLHMPTDPFPLEEMARIAKPRNIPILVDAAAEDLTIPNDYLQRGASVVAYSGGKAICGPQNAGLLLGNKDILMSAWQASAPHHGPGRDNKVAKGEAIGMLAAVEAWIARDHAAKEREWMTWLDNIGKRVSAINGITYSIREPRGLNNRGASLSISWDPEVFNIYGTDVSELLMSSRPRIALSGTYLDENGRTSISVGSKNMQPGNDRIIADRLYEVLSKKYEKTVERIDAPRFNIAGRWDVDIEFYSSKRRHTFYIEQDGNFITGSHKGSFTTRDMYGMVNGDKIILSSSERQNAQSVPFTFHGTMVDGKIVGGIHMGEYLAAKGFTATRYRQTTPNLGGRPMRVPTPTGQGITS